MIKRSYTLMPDVTIAPEDGILTSWDLHFVKCSPSPVKLVIDNNDPVEIEVGIVIKKGSILKILVEQPRTIKGFFDFEVI